MIFHLGFSEGGLGTGAPEDRLLRLVHQAFLNENRERAQDFCFVFGIHRQIRMFPVAEHAEPLELFALDVDEFSGKRFAPLADLKRRKFARFLYHFVFDRKSMAVPTRDIRSAFAEHRLRLHHEILEDFVECRAHVDVSVGKRRAVMQNE